MHMCVCVCVLGMGGGGGYFSFQQDLGSVQQYASLYYH